MKVVCKTMGCPLPVESHEMIELVECSRLEKADEQKQWIRCIATISQQSIFLGKPDTAKTDDFFHIVWGAGSLYAGKLIKLLTEPCLKGRALSTSWSFK